MIMIMFQFSAVQSTSFIKQIQEIERSASQILKYPCWTVHGRKRSHGWQICLFSILALPLELRQSPSDVGRTLRSEIVKYIQSHPEMVILMFLCFSVIIPLDDNACDVMMLITCFLA